MNWGIHFLADPDLPGTGEITGAFWHPNRQILAVASSFRLLTTPPARAATGGHALRHRLALYRPPERRPFAVYDRVRFPVRDVAFHPSESVVAIGGGSYDWKTLFEGQLALWNWEQSRSSETTKVPEVMRLRFSEAGDTLHATVRPWDDHLREGQRNPYRTFYPLTLRYGDTVSLEEIHAAEIAAQIERATPHTEGFDTDGFPPLAADATGEVTAAFQLVGLKQRSPVWDVAAIGDTTAVVHDGCLLEIYGKEGDLLRSFEGSGQGVQLFAGRDLVIHVNHHDPESRSWETDNRSQLMILTKGELKNLASFEYAYTFSRSRDGLLVGRHNRVMLRVANDVVVEPASAQTLSLDLGRYDLFNHYLRIDGAPYLFFIQGTPPYSNERKQLCAVNAGGGVHRFWPLLEDGVDHVTHATECSFEFVQDDLGESIIAAGKVPQPAAGTYDGFLYRKSLKTGQVMWRHKTAASASCIKSIPSRGVIVAAFLDGSLALLRASNGDIVRWEPFTPDGHASVVYSLAVDAEHIVLGTIDGRFGVAPISRFIAGASATAVA